MGMKDCEARKFASTKRSGDENMVFHVNAWAEEV